MTYRSILTYVDGDDTSSQRLASAIGIARQFDAHLTALAMGYEPNIPPYAYGEAAGAVMADLVASANADAAARAEEAGAALDHDGLLADVVPMTCRFNAVSREIGEYAQFSDLVVISHPYGDAVAHTAADVFEGALFDGDAAVLVCPEGTDRILGDNVVIAWSGTREALRAVRRAMPVLAKARNVEIVVIDPPMGNPDPGERLAMMLSRHNITVDIIVQPASAEPVSAILQQRVAELGAGLLVMGGYGHSRFREYVIGGVTREVATEATVPVLMAH